MYFLVKCEKCFDKFNELWEKVTNIIKQKFNRELIYNKIYLKA